MLELISPYKPPTAEDMSEEQNITFIDFETNRTIFLPSFQRIQSFFFPPSLESLDQTSEELPKERLHPFLR